jgi:hypothetical protein
MPHSAIVRKSSQEVLRIDPSNRDFRPQDPLERPRWDRYFEMRPNVNVPDGAFVQPGNKSGRSLGDARVLNFSKHYDVGTNTCRNSTQDEIDGTGAVPLSYQAYEELDKKDEATERSIQLDNEDDVEKRRVVNLLREIKFQAERTNAKLTEVMNVLETFGNLNDLKAAIAGLSELPSSISVQNMRTRLDSNKRANKETD